MLKTTIVIIPPSDCNYERVFKTTAASVGRDFVNIFAVG